MSLKNVRLTVGSFVDDDPKATLRAEDGSWIEKPVKMVYAGKFESMDGPVEIKDEDIDKLVSNHNGLMAKVARMAKGEVPLTHQPPIQLDHSPSAMNTVGRLRGDLSIGEHVDDDGNKHKALMGRMRILGKENVEKVEDGRWATVSIGADLENHKVNELSITPFPAAAGATMLAKLHKDLEIEGHPVRIYQNTMTGKWVYETTWHSGISDSEAEAMSEAKECIAEFHAKNPGLGSAGVPAQLSKDAKLPGNVDEALWDKAKRAYEHAKAGGSNIDDKWAFITAWYKDQGGKFSKGEKQMGMKETKEKAALYEKCHKHLTDHKKMSEEDAEKHLEKADDKELKHLSEEHDKHMKHLAEKEETEKAEREKMHKQMTAHKGALVTLAKGVKATGSKVQLALNMSKISTRLSRLQASAKITPAEVKSMKVEELAGKSDEAIDAALSSYESRQPVIDVGIIGSTRALRPSQLPRTLKMMNMEKEELQSRLNMPSKREAAQKRLAEIEEHEKKLAENHVPGQLDYSHQMADGEDEHDKHFEAAYAHAKKLSDEGKHDEAKEHLRAYAKSLHGHLSGETHTVVSDPHPAMSALAAEVKNMQTQFNEFVKLTAPAFGATAEELI